MKKVLLIVDVQNDFCPGGSLAVANGDKIIPNINKLSMSGKFDLVIATQDWHPKKHCSFASRHGIKPFSKITKPDFSESVTAWPDHCIKGSIGAELRPSLNQENIKFIVRKGMNLDLDSYSAFVENDNITETGLSDLLKPYSFETELYAIVELYVVGIATEVCVKSTVLDGSDLFEHVYLIKDACANINDEEAEKVIDQLKTQGILITNTEEVMKKI